MRLCKSCKSKLILKVATLEPYWGSYYWSCEKYPYCKKIESTFLKKIESNSWLLKEYERTRIKYTCALNQITDSERHYAISNNYSSRWIFSVEEITELDLKLGFVNSDDFYFWMAAQQFVINKSCHNYFPVKGTYKFTFQNLTKAINVLCDDIITKIILEQAAKVKSTAKLSVKEWTIYVMSILKTEYKRKKKLKKESKRDL